VYLERSSEPVVALRAESRYHWRGEDFIEASGSGGVLSWGSGRFMVGIIASVSAGRSELAVPRSWAAMPEAPPRESGKPLRAT
jgi:hypothetical protein